MGPKQAMALDLTTATRAELLKAESVLFRAKMKTMSGSPLQREYSEKYWQVRAAIPDFSAIPKSQNGSLRFKSASERDTAFRMLKAARVRFPGVLQKAVDNRTGVYLILFPGASQLVTAAHWENAMDTAGVQQNPLPRAKALKFIEAAAAQGDMAQATRLYIENRVSMEAYNEAVRRGRNFAKFIEDRDAKKAQEQNPQFTRPSLIGSVVDTYFPVDLMEGSVKGAVEDLKDLVGRGGGKGRGQKRK